HVIPFPVNEPELWSAYVPEGVTQYLRLFSEWGGTKLERMRDAGYEVVILDEGVEKEISGRDVREALRDGGEWESLVPPGVARVIRSFQRVTVCSSSRSSSSSSTASPTVRTSRSADGRASRLRTRRTSTVCARPGRAA